MGRTLNSVFPTVARSQQEVEAFKRANQHVSLASQILRVVCVVAVVYLVYLLCAFIVIIPRARVRAESRTALEVPTDSTRLVERRYPVVIPFIIP